MVLYFLVVRLLWMFLLLLAVSAGAAVNVVGVVLEEDTDRPLAGAQISFTSGKPLGKTNSRGQFEIQVERRDALLMVRQPGYRPAEVRLEDYADLLDVTVTLRLDATQLEATTVQGRQEKNVGLDQPVPIRSLEDMAGMRFDLAEHLAQMPGVSGQKDFSSDLYIDGSRAEEVAYFLGTVRVPSMRHIDVGFPGNLSVVNPHVLDGVRLHQDPGTGPLDQGLASAVELRPAAGDPERVRMRGTMGSTVREAYVSGPWFFWDSFVLSFRWLDPSILENMGQKYFTDYRKRESTCVDCRVQGHDNAFKLSAWDLYAHLSDADSSGASQSFTVLLSADEYRVSQDTSIHADSVQNINIVEGSQWNQVLSYEYASAGGTLSHLAWVRSERGDTLRDTAGFGNDPDPDFRTFISGGKKETTSWLAGLDVPVSGKTLGGEFSWAAEYERRSHLRTYPDSGRVLERTQDANLVSGVARLRTRSGFGRFTWSAGALSDLGGAAPLAGIDWEKRRDDGWRWFATSAVRSQYDIGPVGDGELEGVLRRGVIGRAGVGRTVGRFEATGHGFGRWYPDPALPEPPGLWYYREKGATEYAWVGGASLKLEWRTLHSLAMGTNLTSAYGEYGMKSGEWLPWPSNARIDAVSNIRWYPRNDSLVSLVLTHRAAWHRPIYAWDLELPDSVGSGTRSIREAGSTDLFRTDVRINLDLKSRWKPLEDLRFFFEADNVFSGIGSEGVPWLGGINERPRSAVVVDTDGEEVAGGERLVPYLAKGMGLYIQFGIEANLGF